MTPFLENLITGCLHFLIYPILIMFISNKRGIDMEIFKNKWRITSFLAVVWLVVSLVWIFWKYNKISDTAILRKEDIVSIVYYVINCQFLVVLTIVLVFILFFRKQQNKQLKLMKCPTCQKNISKNAFACPGCGEPICKIQGNPETPLLTKEP